MTTSDNIAPPPAGPGDRTTASVKPTTGPSGPNGERDWAGPGDPPGDPSQSTWAGPTTSGDTGQREWAGPGAPPEDDPVRAWAGPGSATVGAASDAPVESTGDAIMNSAYDDGDSRVFREGES